MKRIGIVIALVASSLALYAQKQVTGTCVNSEHVPISDVVITMFAGDTTLFEVTDSAGTFSLPLVTDSFALHFDHVAYTRLQQIYTTPNVGKVVLESTSTELNEVSVTAFRPMVKVEDGALKYDLTQLAEGTTATNVYEVISKLPGVQEKDGTFELAGAGGVTVIINGKPSNMTAEQLETYLRSMPVERIKSAEVTYSAPPQYNVRGAAINLVLERTQDHRYSGEVKGDYQYKYGHSGKGSASFMVSHPKWSTDVMYSGGAWDRYQLLDQTAHHTVNDSTHLIKQKNHAHSVAQHHFVRAAFDYTPKDNQTLSIYYTGNFSPATTQEIISDGTFVKSESWAHGSSQTHIASVRYQDPCGLDVGANYTYYNTGSEESLRNAYANGDSTALDYHQGQTISRVNVHADMKHTFQKWNLTYGVKGAWTQTEDQMLYDHVVGLPTYELNSQTTEWNAEAYVGASVNFSKGSLSASVAGAYNNWNGHGQFNVYPQANFSWMFSNEHILQANFRTYKDYPPYWMMQNTITYVDGYTEVHNTSSLRPQTTYQLTGTYILKKRYSFTLFFSQTDDWFTQAAYMVPDRLAMIHKHVNFDYERIYGLSVSVPFSFAEWHKSNLFVTGRGIHDKCSDFFGLSIDRKGWLGYVNLDNTFVLCKKPMIALEVEGGYQTPTISGMYDIDQAWWLNAGMKFGFLKNALKLTLKAYDIFNTRQPRVRQDVNGQQYDLYTGANTRIFYVTLSYNFGGYTSKQRESVDTSRFGH